MLEIVKKYLLELQKNICDVLENEDDKIKFIEDPWEHHSGGGGISKIATGKNIIEKAGVNFSHIFGSQLPGAATIQRPELQKRPFHAIGLSTVIHPLNPFIPTTHANLRFIIVEKKSDDSTWWFGGGFDLTPYYGFLEDCIHWHQTAKNACDPFGPDVYSQYKKACDQYFYLKHRNEPRGIGGLFFDDLNWGFEKSFEFIKNIGNHFIKAYQPILHTRKNNYFDQKHRDFQAYRRGRYVEFNLLQDRGTLFGLQSGGRTESILMSLPPDVKWIYNWAPELGSEEEALYKQFLITKDWI